MSELLPAGTDRLLTDSTLLKIGERYYETKSLLPSDFTVAGLNDYKNFSLQKGLEISPNVAYLLGEYYYIYKGKLSELGTFENPSPGIYYDDNECCYVLCSPETEEEKAEYSYGDKITTLDADEIRNAVLNREVIIVNIPDVVHSNIPPEDISDDVLKRAIKRALLAKGIDLDQCRTRFASKNMLFNFKSVLRGDNRLSMLLFERGTEALNLKYTIILEEGGGEIVGRPLDTPITISSSDVFDTSLVGSDENPKVESSSEYEDDEEGIW